MEDVLHSKIVADRCILAISGHMFTTFYGIETGRVSENAKELPGKITNDHRSSTHSVFITMCGQGYLKVAAPFKSHTSHQDELEKNLDTYTE